MLKVVQTSSSKPKPPQIVIVQSSEGTYLRGIQTDLGIYGATRGNDPAVRSANGLTPNKYGVR